MLQVVAPCVAEMLHLKSLTINIVTGVTGFQTMSTCKTNIKSLNINMVVGVFDGFFEQCTICTQLGILIGKAKMGAWPKKAIRLAIGNRQPPNAPPLVAMVGCGADFLVGGCWRLSSRQFLPAENRAGNRPAREHGTGKSRVPADKKVGATTPLSTPNESCPIQANPA